MTSDSVPESAASVELYEGRPLNEQEHLSLVEKFLIEPDCKLTIIKIVKEITCDSLKDAKDWVEANIIGLSMQQYRNLRNYASDEAKI